MSKPRSTCTLSSSLLALFLALIPYILAAAPPAINIIQTPTTPVLNGSSNARITVLIDAEHRLFLTNYAYREPARNFLAAVIGTTAANFEEYHERREEFQERGMFVYDNYGVHVWFDNEWGLLTYILANEMMAALGNFLFERNLSEAKFQLLRNHEWELQSISYGQIVWRPNATSADT